MCAIDDAFRGQKKGGGEGEEGGDQAAMVAPGKQSAGATLGCLLQWLRARIGVNIAVEHRFFARGGKQGGGREGREGEKTYSRREMGIVALIMILQTVHWI